jgi:large conductance mechanosensitive channel
MGGMMSFMQEFKQFAMRGNVMDLAVAVVIAAAFGKIISSLVDGIIMPVIGLMLGGINISDKTITVGQAVIKWGVFLQSVIDFSLIAFSIFVVIKLINHLKPKKEEPIAEMKEEVKLLTEIRDALRNQRN